MRALERESEMAKFERKVRNANVEAPAPVDPVDPAATAAPVTAAAAKPRRGRPPKETCALPAEEEAATVAALFRAVAARDALDGDVDQLLAAAYKSGCRGPYRVAGRVVRIGQVSGKPRILSYSLRGARDIEI